MEQKKIDELKKFILFGLCLIEKMKDDGEFTMHLISGSQKDLIKLLSNFAFLFGDEYKHDDISSKFEEPQTTKLLEQAYQEYMKYKRL